MVAFFPVAIMSPLLLQFIIVAGFGALCFGCGYLTGFIVTRNQWRDEMIERGVARYHWQTGRPANGIGGSRRKNRRRRECDDLRCEGLRRTSPSCGSYWAAIRRGECDDLN